MKVGDVVGCGVVAGSVRKIHLSLSTMARREGNLDVAKSQLKEAKVCPSRTEEHLI